MQIFELPWKSKLLGVGAWVPSRPCLALLPGTRMMLPFMCPLLLAQTHGGPRPRVGA